METPWTAPPLASRLVEGLERLATAIKTDDWGKARALGINPTQMGLLAALEGRLSGLGVKDLALLLGISQPTATDSIVALERKGLLAKQSDPNDGRSVRVLITDAGRNAVGQRNQLPGAVQQAAAGLEDHEQEQLLALTITLIRQLQERGAIPIQRMCVSCRHFRPYAHADAAQPHHCNFVDAAFGPQDLRIDCREYEAADPSVRAATWAKLQKDRPIHPPGT